MAKKKAEFRVRFEYETDVDLSYLEQWNTPEKYYGEIPKCSQGTNMKYTTEFGGKDEDRWLCDCVEDDVIHETKDPLEICDLGKGGVMLVKGKPITFSEYMSTYGNPENHVVLYAAVDRKCTNCGDWDSNVESLGNIDFMDSDDYSMGSFTEEDVRLDLKGYCAEVANDLLSEAKKRGKDCCEPRVTVCVAIGKHSQLVEVPKNSVLGRRKNWTAAPKKRTKKKGAKS